MTVFVDSFIESAVHYGGLALLHGTMLALITWLLTATILRRRPPAVHAFLWTIVLIKFVVPPVLPGEMALSSWIGKTTDHLIATQTVNSKSMPSSIVERQDNGEAGSESSVVKPDWARWIAGCYVGLVIVLIGRAARSLRRAKRSLLVLRRAPDYVENEVAALALRIGLKVPPEIRLTHNEFTPYVFGLRRPVLVLPERLMDQFPVTDRRSMILHELAHIRRKDVAARYLQSAARILFFFFPPILWISRRIEHCSELACDQWAVAISRSDPIKYASVLVKVAREVAQPLRPYAGLPLIRKPRLLEQRVRAVLDDRFRTPPLLSRRTKLWLTCWCLFVLMGGATAQVAQQESGTASTKTEERITSSGTYSTTSKRENRSKQVVEKAAQASAARASKNGTRSASDERANDSAAANFVSQTALLQSGRKLSEFEIGYLLGRRYAEERAESSGSPHAAGSDLKSKREIELQMQSRNKHLPQQ